MSEEEKPLWTFLDSELMKTSTRDSELMKMSIRNGYTNNIVLKNYMCAECDVKKPVWPPKII